MAKANRFSARLREVLDTRGMTATELSKRTGISKSSISHYLKGDWKAKQDAVYKIALATDCDEAWLMGYDVKMERTRPGSGLIATDDPSYNPFFDETNEYYGDDVAWRKLHGMVDARPKLEAVVRACMELTDEQLDKILQMIGLMI